MFADTEKCWSSEELSPNAACRNIEGYGIGKNILKESAVIWKFSKFKNGKATLWLMSTFLSWFIQKNKKKKKKHAYYVP